MYVSTEKADFKIRSWLPKCAMGATRYFYNALNQSTEPN